MCGIDGNEEKANGLQRYETDNLSSLNRTKLASEKRDGDKWFTIGRQPDSMTSVGGRAYNK